MRKLFSVLPDEVYLSQVNIPGTHDSCTAFCTMENMSRCQSLTVKEQLRMGIRLFDIRLGRKKGDFFLVHALATCFSDKEKKKVLLFDEVLKAFREFLRENPEETLVVSIKQDRGIMSRFFFPAFFEKYIKGKEKEWYLKNENPALSECRGKMVLMRRCKVWRGFLKKNDAGLDFSFWPDQGSKKKTTTESFPVAYALLTDKEPSLMTHIQDRYSLEPKIKWRDCAKPFLDLCKADKSEINIHFISTSFRYPGETLERTADELNGYFSEYELKKDLAQGWMLFDFPPEELIDKVITSNFGIYKEKLK